MESKLEWELATRVLAVVGALTGIAGTVLGAWARWEQIQDAKRRRAASDPRAAIKVSQIKEHGWRAVTVTFTNPVHHRFLVSEVECQMPKGSMLCRPHDPVAGRLVPDDETASERLPVEWVVEAAAAEPVQSQTIFFLSPASEARPMQSSPLLEPSAKEFSIHFKAREISSRRRQVLITAHTVIKE
jgi:hypothetical protein